MENEFGYDETQALANRLGQRARAFVYDADDTQSEGMKPYLESQQSSLEQEKGLQQKFKNDLTEVAQKVIGKADEKANASLLCAYGAYGLKEI